MSKLSNLVISLGVVALGFGCGAVCPVLNVIADATKDACPVVAEYLDEDGKKQQVALPHDLLLDAVQVAALKSGKPLPKGKAGGHLCSKSSASSVGSQAASASVSAHDDAGVDAAQADAAGVSSASVADAAQVDAVASVHAVPSVVVKAPAASAKPKSSSHK